MSGVSIDEYCEACSAIHYTNVTLSTALAVPSRLADQRGTLGTGFGVTNLLEVVTGLEIDTGVSMPWMVVSIGGGEGMHVGVDNMGSGSMERKV